MKNSDWPGFLSVTDSRDWQTCNFLMGGWMGNFVKR